MPYSTKYEYYVKCIDKTYVKSSASYSHSFEFIVDFTFNEIKIDGLIIETTKDELFEFESDDVLCIEYICHNGNSINSKIPGLLINKLCTSQHNYAQFSEIPNCTYIKIPTNLLINTNNSQIKRIPTNSKILSINKIKINLSNKINTKNIHFIIKTYKWNILPFINRSISLRLFNTTSYDARYLGLFIKDIDQIKYTGGILGGSILYDETSVKNNSSLVISDNDIKHKESLYQLYLVLPNDIIRKIKLYLDDNVYWMPYEPNIDWKNATNSCPHGCYFTSDSQIVHMYGMNLY